MDKNLTAFLAVARTKTLTEASNLVGITQPSVTKRIANLEAEFDARLFQRNHRGMSLTAAGEIFFRRAKKIEKEYRQCREEISAISSAGLSELRVGAGPLFHLNSVARLFSTLKALFPDLRLELTTDTKVSIGQMLSEGELDVYLGIIPPEQIDESHAVTYLTTVEHGLVVRPDNPYANMDRIDPAKLEQLNWVIFAVDPETERSIKEYCVPGTDSSPTIDVRTTSFATGLQLVSQGSFVMSAPLQLAERIKQAGLVIRPTLNGMPKRRAGIYTRKSSAEFGAIRATHKFFEDENFEL